MVGDVPGSNDRYGRAFTKGGNRRNVLWYWMKRRRLKTATKRSYKSKQVVNLYSQGISNVKSCSTKNDTTYTIT